MSNMKRSMRRVFWLLALCFFLLLGYLGKLVFVDREEISGNSYNSRLRYVDETIKRGDILDREGEVIATSTRQEDGTYKREYPRGRMAAHITGYSSVGKTGVEAAENFELMKLHNELFQRVSSVVRKTELQRCFNDGYGYSDNGRQPSGQCQRGDCCDGAFDGADSCLAGVSRL